MVTGIDGIRSQGEIARAWMFCACCSRTPQEMAGGRNPRPRKLREVSLMIMAGTARVVAAMMWLRNEGTRCVNMIRICPQPQSSAAMTKSS